MPSVTIPVASLTLTGSVPDVGPVIKIIPGVLVLTGYAPLRLPLTVTVPTAMLFLGATVPTATISFVTASDLQIRLSTKSGAAGDTTSSTPVDSLGKYISTTELISGVLENLHRSPTQAELEADVDLELYKCFFILNTHPTSTAFGVAIYIASGDIDGQIALATDDTGITNKDSAPVQALSVTNEQTVPAGLTFEHINNESDAVNLGQSTDQFFLGDLAPNDCIAIWVRLRIRYPNPSAGRRSPVLMLGWATGLQTMRPDADLVTGNWDTAPISSQDLFEQINEDAPSDTDYIFLLNADEDTGPQAEIDLTDIVDTGSDLRQWFRFRIGRNASGSGFGIVTGRLQQGSTLILNVSLITSTTPITIAFIAPPENIGLITDYSTLKFVFNVSSATGGREGRVFWAEFEVPSGVASKIINLAYDIIPTATRISLTLNGDLGPIVSDYRFEKRTHANTFLADITPAFIRMGSWIELNNDRAIKRTANFIIDPTQVTPEIDPLKDHVMVLIDILIDDYVQTFELGLFHFEAPKKTIEPGREVWSVAGNDLTIHLVEATTTAPYVVTATTNYITAVETILDNQSLTHALPVTTLVLPEDMVWDVGTPWITIVNDLLTGTNMYSIWADVRGVFHSRPWGSLALRTADVVYTDQDIILIPFVEQAELTRFANQVIVKVDDPAAGELFSLKTNDDPSNPISTVTLGRTITKVVARDTVADQATLDLIAERILEEAASLYLRGTIWTSIDPRRQAHEVYDVTVDTFSPSSKWWVRSWRMPLDSGGRMKHEIAHIESLVAS